MQEKEEQELKKGDSEAFLMNINNLPIKIQIRSKTWIRDSHGLFDYENSQVKTSTIVMNQNGSLFRKNNHVKYSPAEISIQDFSAQLKSSSEENESVELGKFTNSNNKILFSNPIGENLPVNNQTLTELQEKIWHVVKTNNSNQSVVNSNNSYLSSFKYQLRKNDIIKLGRIKFVIKDINIAEGSYETTQQTFRPYQDCEKIEAADGEICRICLFNNNDEETNPIITICKCKGSINLIHLNCLKLWLQQKLSTREISNKPGISYTIKSFNCELCKEPYPTTIKFKENLYHLMNYFIPEGQNYIILESLNSIKENQYPLSIHVLMYIDNDEHFILGRGHESDVRISDISVSRSHAKISFKNKNFILEDTGSKFGTLVLAKDPVQIQEGTLILQVGRTLISMCEYKGENEKSHFSELNSKKTSGSSEHLNIDKFNLEKDEICNNYEKLEDDIEEDLN